MTVAMTLRHSVGFAAALRHQENGCVLVLGHGSPRQRVRRHTGSQPATWSSGTSAMVYTCPARPTVKSLGVGADDSEHTWPRPRDDFCTASKRPAGLRAPPDRPNVMHVQNLVQKRLRMNVLTLQ